MPPPRKTWPHGENVLTWPDRNDEPTPTYAGNYIQRSRSEWLSRHLYNSLQRYKEGVGIHPARSLQAASYLVLREKRLEQIVKERAFS